MSSTICVYRDNDNNIIDCGIFYKMVKNQYIESLLNGDLWMNRLDYFRKKNDNNALGDSMEGLVYHIDKGNAKISNEEEFKVENFNIFANSEYPIFCISFPDYFTKNDNEENYVITEETIDKLTEKKYTDYTIIFINKNELVKRIEKEILKTNYYAEHGKIIYNEQGYIFDKTNPIKNAGFVKRKIYEYQKEYRFMIHNEVPDHLVLSVGDIHDICKPFPIEGKQEIKLTMK